MAYSGKERVIAALKHEIPDRVPTFEWLVDKKIADHFIPGGTPEDFCAKYLDAIIVDFNYSSKDLGNGVTVNEWGVIHHDTGEAHAFPVDGPIHNREEFEAYVPPAPDAEGRCDNLKRVLARYGDEKAVILHMNDVWSLPSRMMKFEDFLMMILDETDLVADILKMTVDAQIKLAEQAARCGAKFIFTGDDVAYSNGPMISPSIFREIFFPEMKRIVKAYKDLGFYVLKHTDGNIMPMIDMFTSAGFDLLDPIDPIAGMDLQTIKSAYGSKIAIKGNVNCATTLVYGSIEETVAETKKCLAIGMPGGGYVCSSSNSIHASINPANYAAMLETIDRFGKY